jgi:hypothetical protein
MRRVRMLAVPTAGAAVLTFGALGVTSTAAAPPCNDTNGDGAPSGQEYAQYHIVPLAQAGQLGAGGHIPGSHQGFSLCLGVHE